MLGEGGGGIVYAGSVEHDGGPQLVTAVKILHASQIGNREQLECFPYGVVVGSCCGHHDNQVRTHGYRDDSRRGHQRARGLGPSIAIEQLDIHPKNIYIGFDGVVRMDDFGSAQAQIDLQSDKKPETLLALPPSRPVSYGQIEKRVRFADHGGLSVNGADCSYSYA